MSLSAGTKLGVYEIVEPIGKGGMGEVYRARDTKLGRDVAIKLLPGDLAGHSDRLARFEREAKLLASLNHPGIATLYGFEESHGVHFLAMELVPGATLAERIASGPIPLEEALAIARQIADALEAAHEAGVIHRDLKPPNIKVTDDGKVKVLDFGLAKAFADEATPIDSSLSPTLTRAGTMAGIILGTAAYMSPEQARGKSVDKRSDIFAFGCVLFEMLTGRKAFDGETVSDILAAVIKTEPDWTHVPPEVQSLVERCLEKDVRKRYRDIGDVRLDLDAAPAVAAVAGSVTGRRASRWPVAVATLVAFGLGLAVSWMRPRTPTALPVVRSQLLPPEGEEFAANTMELSPSGDLLTFADDRARGRRRLWVRRLDELDARPLDGTEGADYPFWSPDGRSIGFFARDTLKVVSATGGAPRTLVPAPNGRGGTWSEDGVILFGADPGGILHRVDASGGEAKPVTTPGEEDVHRHPYFLPDGRHFVFSIGSPFSIWLGDLETGETQKIIHDAYDAKYVPPGWLTYMTHRSQGALFAQRFDVDGLALVAEPISVATGLRVGGPAGASYTVSRTNLLAYAPRGEGFTRLWIDRAGKTIELGPDPADAPGWTYRISPSGRRLALGGLGLGVMELDRPVYRRLPTTSDKDVATLYPTWSPDESKIAYLTNKEIRIVAVDGSSDESLTEWWDMEEASNHLEWSPDGRSLLVAGADSSLDDQVQLWLVGVDDGVAEPWFTGDADFTEARFSPDGHWVAYRSDETGISEVYVRPFPGPGRPLRVSTSGGGTPEWRGDGRELFYLTLEGALVSVDVRYGERLTVSTPRPLIPFVGSNPFGASTRYHVTPDGQRFLVRRGERRPLELVQGWLDVLGK